MAEHDCKKYGKGFDPKDWECEACPEADKCKKLCGGGKKDKPAAKTASKKAPAAKEKKNDVKKSKKAPAKKAAPKKAAKKAPAKKAPAKKAPAKKAAPKKAAKKKTVSKAVVITSEEKAFTKQVKKDTKEIAAKILKYVDGAKKANYLLITKGGPLMIKAKDMLSPDRFKEWCKDELGYDYKVIYKFIQAYNEFKGQHELLENLGQLKMNPILAHPEPVKFLEENREAVLAATGREVREMVTADKLARAGGKGSGKGGPDDPILTVIKLLQGSSSQMDKNGEGHEAQGQGQEEEVSGWLLSQGVEATGNLGRASNSRPPGPPGH
jgi:hypothetical protein